MVMCSIDVETERNTSANEEEFPPSPPSEELVLRVMEEMWRFNDCYSVSNVVGNTDPSSH